MGSQDQHQQSEPQTAVERRAAQAAKVRQVDHQRRVRLAQRTGEDIPEAPADDTQSEGDAA
ncbi:hypothetical protein [Streptomyces sp. NPDC003730]